MMTSGVYWIWPWGSISWVTTTVEKSESINNPDLVEYPIPNLELYYEDAGTTGYWESHPNASKAKIYGNLRRGFFPPHWGSIRSGHYLVGFDIGHGYPRYFFHWE
jgi:hypothetical protein